MLAAGLRALVVSLGMPVQVVLRLDRLELCMWSVASSLCSLLPAEAPQVPPDQVKAIQKRAWRQTAEAVCRLAYLRGCSTYILSCKGSEDLRRLEVEDVQI